MAVMIFASAPNAEAASCAEKTNIYCNYTCKATGVGYCTQQCKDECDDGLCATVGADVCKAKCENKCS